MRHTTMLVGLLLGLTFWACGGDPTSPGEEKAAISFLRVRSPGIADLFVVAANGTGLTQILDSTQVWHEQFVPRHPYEWSHDGEYLAFAHPSPSGDMLVVMDASGSAVTDVLDITRGRSPSLSWSPDQRRLVVTRGKKVSVVNRDGSGLRDIIDSSAVTGPSYFSGAQWSPDGNWIAFYGRGRFFWGMHLVNSSGDNHHVLPTEEVRDPRWSPDGTRLAYWDKTIKTVGLNHSDIFLAPGSFPEWSPDGSRLVFIAKRYWTPCGVLGCTWFDVMVMNADGTGLAQLTNTGANHDFDPKWSPDGSRIAFVSERDGNQEVYVMNADGSGLFNLTQNPADDYAPRWIPRPGG